MYGLRAIVIPSDSFLHEAHQGGGYCYLERHAVVNCEVTREQSNVTEESGDR